MRGKWKGKWRGIKVKEERGNGGERERRKEMGNGSEYEEKIRKITKIEASGMRRGERVPFLGTFRVAPFALQMALLMRKPWPAWHHTAGINWRERGQACSAEAVGSPSLWFGKDWFKPARIISLLGAART